MEFGDLTRRFKDEQKKESFNILQKFILNTKEPFFIGRLSGNETNFCGKVLNQIDIPEDLMKDMLYSAGINFKSNDDVKEYVRLYIKSCLNVNYLGIWSKITYKKGENFFNFLKKMEIKHPVKKICAHGLDFFNYLDNNYKLHQYFKNKKVLIITSHINTAHKQYENIDKLFGKNIFHSTTKLFFYKPPQQNGGNHDNRSWRLHYEKLKIELGYLNEEYDFDIALVSCGGFGMLASNYIFTEFKKSVIYVGGSLQLFLGILGRRWTQNEDVKKLINKYWVFPDESDKPKNTLLCDNSCYW